MTAATLIRRADQNSAFCSGGMRLSWPQHLQTARMLELSKPEQRGTALALMGMALLLLSGDLLNEATGPSEPDRH